MKASRTIPAVLTLILLCAAALVSCTDRVDGTAGDYRHRHEKWYREKWCAEHGGRAEWRLSDRTRCDCLTGTHAVEVEFTRKWAEAVGQSLHYARITGKRAGIVLIVDDGAEGLYLERLTGVVEQFHLPIDVWVVKR